MKKGATWALLVGLAFCLVAVGCDKKGGTTNDKKPAPEKPKEFVAGAMVTKNLPMLGVRLRAPGNLKVVVKGPEVSLVAEKFPTVHLAKEKAMVRYTSTSFSSSNGDVRFRVSSERGFRLTCSAKGTGKHQALVESICRSIESLGGPYVLAKCEGKGGFDAAKLKAAEPKVAAPFKKCLAGLFDGKSVSYSFTVYRKKTGANMSGSASMSPVPSNAAAKKCLYDMGNVVKMYPEVNPTADGSVTCSIHLNKI